MTKMSVDSVPHNGSVSDSKAAICCCFLIWWKREWQKEPRRVLSSKYKKLNSYPYLIQGV
jgi:hypothetical protein